MITLYPDEQFHIDTLLEKPADEKKKDDSSQQKSSTKEKQKKKEVHHPKDPYEEDPTTDSQSN